MIGHCKGDASAFTKQSFLNDPSSVTPTYRSTAGLPLRATMSMFQLVWVTELTVNACIAVKQEHLRSLHLKKKINAALSNYHRE